MFRTSKGAPMFKLATVNVDLHAGQFGAQSVNMWSTFVNEHPEKVLEGAVLAARYTQPTKDRHNIKRNL